MITLHRQFLFQCMKLGESPIEELAALRPVEPQIRSRGMGEREDQLAIAFIHISDRLIESDFPEEAGDRDPADRDDQLRIY